MLLVFGLALLGGRSDADQPLRSWAADFGDPREAERWTLLAPGEAHDRIHWELKPRGASEGAGETVLEVSATGDLAVESHIFLYRELPADFRPDGTNDLVLEWEWLVGDTERTNASGISIVSRVDGEPGLEACYGFASHSRFTSGWAVLFEPPDQWRRRRVSIPSGPCKASGKRPSRHVGIGLEISDPVRQIIRLAQLAVEEWPGGSLEPDPVLQPRRPPPPDRAFAPLPLDRLQRATAGALEDLDGDGLPELLMLERGGYAHLYGNRGGAFRRDLTEASGLAFSGLGTGALFADLDADRDPDLVVTAEFEVPRFFENRGGLRFRPRRDLVSDRKLSFWYGVAADDVDRDGDPDLLAVSPLAPHFSFLRNAGGWRLVQEELFDPRQLLEGGKLSFTASFGDADADGWPDLFLGREYLLRNRRGTFEVDPAPWPRPLRNKTEGGVWADLTGAGRLDLRVLRDRWESTWAETLPAPGGEPVSPRSRWFAGEPSGGFREIALDPSFPHLESA
ncbi:MAG: VCBS repeat-containing protein, partial [Holophagales bacterium]|nr:VCBS repeat-containing protein [Holophagales bacterium]